MTINLPNESPDYRKARNKLLQAEIELREKVEEVAALRRQLPQGGALAEDYEFRNVELEPIKLSELFKPGKDSLIIYSYMFGLDDQSPCPACTSILDSLDGTARHLTEVVNLAVVISGTIDQAKHIKALRGWNHLNMYSCAGNRYNRDYFGENSEGVQMPMLNVFCKRDTDIFHFWGTELLYAPTQGHPRHVDQIWPLWNLLDLLPQGRVGDLPKLNYGA